MITLVATLVLGTTLREIWVGELIRTSENQNVALAQSFANQMWPRFQNYVRTTDATTQAELLARPETQQIHATLQALTANLPVLKVKIYNLAGVTIYSSEQNQIGDDKSQNPGFNFVLDARQPATKMSYRDSFSAFSGTVYERDLVESYLPIFDSDGEMEGVFELYTDVSSLVKHLDRSLALIIAGVLLAFSLLYLALLLIVRRASGIIDDQHRDLQLSENDLIQKNSDLSAMTNEFALACNRAEAANNSKTEFLANMSHELRTPLNAVIGFSEVIMSQSLGRIAPKYREYAGDIHASGKHLLSLINDILDIAKIESGSDELYEETVDLNELADETARMLQPRGLRALIALRVEVAEGVPGISADRRKLRQILLNLLSNGIKFTEAGGEVSLRVSYSGGHVLEVADTGIGMAPDDIPKAMAKFGQIDSYLVRKQDGTGLGLPLAKALAEQHGGSLNLDSKPGVGTTATVYLPQARTVHATNTRVA